MKGILALLLSSASVFAEPMIIGHRGLGKHHFPEPENSIPSLVTALRNGADAVEFDIQLSSDGVVFLGHDAILDTITEGNGCISETTFETIRRLKLRDGLGFVHPYLTPVTLEQTLEAIQAEDYPDRSVLANIHIKIYDGRKGDFVRSHAKNCLPTAYAPLTDSALRIVERLGLIDRVIFTSFDERVLERIKAQQPLARTGVLSYFAPGSAIRHAAKHGHEVVVFAKPFACNRKIARAHKAGLEVYVWFPRTDRVPEDIVDLSNVEGIITDHPEEASEVDDWNL